MWPFSVPRNPYHETIAVKRAHRAEAIKLAPPFDPEKHQKYLNATASQIVKNIQARTWTASAVLEAYIARAAQAHQATNCLTEVFFEEAIEEARQLDTEFSQSGCLKGPLHGVPFSAKDLYDVKGFDSTIGYTQWANNPAERDAALVKILRNAGAIIIGKTNVPQTLSGFESDNPLWGRTCNPWSVAYTAGGSSGGEGALLAADGAVLGFGTDLGGSTRVPSGYCGIFAFKPAQDRISLAGSANPNPAFEACRVVAGPMARSVEDLERVARILFGERVSREDCFPAPVPYRDVTLPKKLRFGYYLNDNIVKGSPASHRAVLETVGALRKAGHECIEIDSPDATRAVQLFRTLYSADGLRQITDPLGPDKKGPSLAMATVVVQLPGFVRAFAGWVIRNLFGDAKFASFLTSSHKASVYEYYNYVTEKVAFEQQMRETLWGSDPGIDAVLGPLLAIPAVPHGGYKSVSPIGGGAMVWNVVSSPVGVVPVTRVDPALDELSDEWHAIPSEASKILENKLYGPQGTYNPLAMKGLPMCVQVVGRPWEEEKVLAMMHVIDAALGPRGFGPGSWAPDKQVGGAQQVSKEDE